MRRPCWGTAAFIHSASLQTYAEGELCGADAAERDADADGDSNADYEEVTCSGLPGSFHAGLCLHELLQHCVVYGACLQVTS